MKKVGVSIFVVLLWSLTFRANAESYALVIGIDEYQDKAHITSLSTACADAKALAQTLQAKALFKANHVQLLVSDGSLKPTRKEILNQISQWQKQGKAEDVFFVFFMGHGVALDTESYLLPYDVNLTSPQTLQETAISAKEWKPALSSIQGKATLLCLDIAHGSPSLNPTFFPQPIRWTDAQLQRLALDKGANGITLFSAKPQQRSHDWNRKQRGYFGYFLEQAYKGEAADGAGVLSVKSLFDYLAKAIPGAVLRDEGGIQDPYSVQSGNIQPIPLATGLSAGKGGESAVPSQIGATPEDKYEAGFQKAYELSKQKKYDEAKQEAQQLLKADGNSVHLLYFLANINWDVL